MRRWRDRAPPDDPNAWADVDGMWPTYRDTYETVIPPLATSYTATGASAPMVGFAFKTLSGRREYVCDTTHIWEWSGSDLTSRLTETAIGYPHMAQFGDATICVRGSTQTTIGSTGANFSTITSAPMGEMVVVQSNAALIFNTNTSTDGWAASDVGDYTNWTTGEAASGRILFPAGSITAAVAFGNDVLVFKSNSIHRMRYVGGTVKWIVELLHEGVGCTHLSGLATDAGLKSKYYVAAGRSCVLFTGFYDWHPTIPTNYVYRFDGSAAPVRVNIETTVKEGPIVYNPQTDVFTIFSVAFTPSNFYYYCASTGAWGKWATTITPGAGAITMGPVTGRAPGSALEQSNTPAAWEFTTANFLKRWQPDTTPAVANPVVYLQTAKVGFADKKTTFNRVIPLLRRRISLGSDSAVLSMELFREREDTTAQTTIGSIAESTFRKRFDQLASAATDNYARFKVTWTALDVEVDDFLVVPQAAGKD